MSCPKTRHSSVSAATFTWIMSLCRRASSSTKAPRRPKPALLTSVSTSTPSARSVAWIASAAPGEARSDTSTRTRTPWAATSSRASSSSRSRERATSTRSRPLRAKSRARAVAREDEAHPENQAARDHGPEVGGVVELHGVEIEETEAGEGHGPEHRRHDGGEHDLEDGHVVPVELADQLLCTAEPRPLLHEAERDPDRHGNPEPEGAALV